MRYFIRIFKKKIFQRLFKESSQKGLTLVEVIVSLLIFGFIGIFIVQNVQNSVKAHKNFKPKMDKDFKLRSVFLLLKRDLNQAFHFKDFYKKEYNEAILEFRKKYRKQIREKKIDFPLKSQKIREDSYFDGTSKKFTMTTLNSLIYFSEDSSYPVYVSYSLESCKTEKEEVTDCFLRKEWLLEKQEPASGVHSQVLIRGVEKLEFFYLYEDTDEKTVAWSSRDGLYKDLFPSAVEVVLETRDKKKFRWVISLHFPNNRKRRA